MVSDLPGYLLDVSTLPKSGFEIKIQATNTQLEAIAAACGIKAVHAFSACVQLTRWRRDGVAVSGNIEATIEQLCVVTLEPLVQGLQTEFACKLIPQGSKLARPQQNIDGEILLDFEGDDPPETFTGNTLDIWEILLEHFNLAIDPYPRAPGAEIETAEVGLSDDEPRQSPFAVLQSLKTRKK